MIWEINPFVSSLNILDKTNWFPYQANGHIIIILGMCDSTLASMGDILLLWLYILENIGMMDVVYWLTMLAVSDG